MLPVLIAFALPLVVVIGMAALLSRNIVKVPPSELLVISGRRRVVRDPESGAQQVVGFRSLSGGSAFRIPVMERIDRLPLNVMSIDVELEDQRNAEGRTQHIGLLVNCHISAEPPLVDQAIQRFLGMALEDIQAIVRATIESRVIDTLLTSDLEADGMTWSALEQRLIAAIRADLGALGLVADNIVFRGPPRAGELPVVARGSPDLRLHN